MEVEGTVGFRVADAAGSRIGLVESMLHGTAPNRADAIAVRSGHLLHRHYIVPAELVTAVDRDRHLVEVRLGRDSLQRFL